MPIVSAPGRGRVGSEDVAEPFPEFSGTPAVVGANSPQRAARFDTGQPVLNRQASIADVAAGVFRDPQLPAPFRRCEARRDDLAISRKSRGAPRFTNAFIFAAMLSAGVSIGKRPHRLATGDSIATSRSAT
ncbi:MAG TPA: hypothetical protein VGU66_21055 [Candidatus Elarobacter sp.]|nr:hypothetical protein [Candidatus Elarobacter sp.]